MQIFWRVVRVLWVSPNSIVGLTIGIVGLMTGGGMQCRRGVLEFWGGFTRWFLDRMRFLNRMPNGQSILAMTLGHTILGQNPVALDVSRDHEHVHVRQYENWGPFFIPLYLGFSIWQWLRGNDPYRNNPFEIEAFADDERRRQSGPGGD